MLLVEFSNYIFSESEANSSIVISVLIDTSLGVGPEQVAKKSSVWHICWSHNVLDLLEVLQLWTQATMHTEYFFIDKSCDR